MTLAAMTAFFGWMAVLNIAFLALAALMMLVAKDRLAALHGGMFGMEEGDVKKAYFTFLANYKILTLVFAVMPYIALKLI